MQGMSVPVAREWAGGLVSGASAYRTGLSLLYHAGWVIAISRQPAVQPSPLS